VVRVQNATGASFDVRLQNPSGAAVSPETVHYIVMEEGAWQMPDGRSVEASLVLSDGTNGKSSWRRDSMEYYAYQQSYNSPVVLGQVMTANDADWSVFWCCNGNRSNAPRALACYVGKHVGEDSDNTRASETLGVIVIEQGSGDVVGTAYQAALGGDSIRGIGNSPPYNYALSGFSSAPEVGVITGAGMDGSEGGWAVLYGASPLTAGSIRMAIDEDQIRDSERRHTSEQVGYLVFESAMAYGPGTGGLSLATLEQAVKSLGSALAGSGNDDGADDEGGSSWVVPAYGLLSPPQAPGSGTHGAGLPM
ncbi:MAG: hypothetical protein ACYTFZ_04890, partial [Planctomycetota bacterium]|jgi:hypothetical protein